MERKDFFVSYNKDNKDWAKWIAGTLEENGYTVYLQAWDIVPGDDFIGRMNDFLRYSENYIAVFSSSFWNSDYCRKEFQTAFNAHLNKDIKKFLPVRIENFSPDVLYKTIVYIDIFNLNEAQATIELLQGIGHTTNPRKKGVFPKFSNIKHSQSVRSSFFPFSSPGIQNRAQSFQNASIRDIIVLNPSKNHRGNLFNSMVYDIIHSLGFGDIRNDVIKPNRECNMILQHRTEKRYAIIESRVQKEKVGCAALNKFAGFFDLQKRQLENEQNSVVGYFISPSGFTSSTIEQENTRTSIRKAGGEESELILLGPNEIVQELILGNVLCSLDKAISAIDNNHDKSLLLCDNVDLIACKQGWIWVLYYSSRPQEGATHFAFVHADGNQLLNEVADIVIKQANGKQNPFSKLTYIKAPSRTILDKQSAKNAYYQYLENELGEIQFEGMPTDKEAGAVKVNLENIFIPLHFNYHAGGENVEHRRKATTIKNILTHTSRAAILAKPGGGKSTLIRRIALAYAYPERRKKVDDGLPDENWFPVYIRCRDLGEDATKNILGIIDTIVHRAEISEHKQAFKSLVEDNLQNGKLLLLIDGLDEISAEKNRIKFVHQLRTFVATYPTVHLVITSREAGFRAVAGTLANYCKQYSIANLNEEEIHNLSLKWHQAIFGDSGQAEDESNKVCAIILNDPRIMALAENPLLLTTLLFVKRWVGYLPTKKCRLYEEMIKLLLVTWNAAGHDKLDMDESEPQLAFVAYQMTSQGKQKITRDKLEKYIREARCALPELLGYTNISPSQFIDKVEERSSLLIQMGLEENDNGTLVPSYEFSHLSFQEYLTAKAISESWLPLSDNNSDLLEVIKPHIEEDHWIEVIPLAAVISGRHAKGLIEHLLELSQSILTSKDDAPEKLALLHLANSVASEVPMNQDLLEKVILCIVKGKNEIRRINFRINSPSLPAQTVNVFSTIIKSRYGNNYRDIISRELFNTVSEEYVYEFSASWLEICLSDYDNTVNEQLVLHLLRSKEHKDKITGALIMMHLVFSSYRKNLQNYSNRQDTELITEIFNLLWEMLQTNNILNIYTVSWCVAWAGYNEADIIPHEIAYNITMRLIDLWVKLYSKGNYKRTISWAIYCICMPDLPIPESKKLIKAIDKNFNEPLNDYDRAAAIHLAILTNYWTATELRNKLSHQEFPFSRNYSRSRLLDEFRLFEKSSSL